MTSRLNRGQVAGRDTGENKASQCVPPDLQNDNSKGQNLFVKLHTKKYYCDIWDIPHLRYKHGSYLALK